ncbi:hypothetical protein BCB68_00315 [Leptotrichia sp. oral taxon 498]|uniref:putative peptidoglycan-binding domain-containing protein n=1 Tax=Leptotrichia sp. oral taxon 498 TaxID=712368 RepID=UPI000B8D3146|nr:putative peptidoglycan-binding domain-containing protein [Leptotrichia sp. oral taxon 498]ASQ47549.1 hypothetical protein BCB68_00315 [Leptotrichia sp. oral taxon 498]
MVNNIWLAKADTSQEAPASKSGSSSPADGIIGLQTVKYLNLVNSEKFLAEYHKLQAEYHKLQIEYYNAVVKSNPKQKVFLAGWLNRVKRKENYLKNV